MNLQCVSFELKSSSAKAKETLVVKEIEFTDVFNQLKNSLGLSELLILSTCNRTEFYYFSSHDKTKLLFDVFKLLKGFKVSKEDLKSVSFINEGRKALNHLAEVSLGMHSQVLGDVQVIHQVKNAYKKSCELGGAQVNLHKVMHRMFALNKKVTSETKFKSGVSSISSAAIQFVKKISKSKNTPILIVGSGDSAEETLKNLLNSGYRDLTIVNRTLSKAQILANKYDVKFKEIGYLKDLVLSHKIIISSLSTDEKVLNRTNVPMSLSTYQYRYFLDLSVLGVVDESIEENPENLVFGLKYMKEQNEETVLERERELPVVRKLISRELDEIESWFLEFKLLNKLKNLTSEVNRLNQQEIWETIKKEFFILEESLDFSFVKKISQRCLNLCERETLDLELSRNLQSVFSVHITEDESTKR